MLGLVRAKRLAPNSTLSRHFDFNASIDRDWPFVFQPLRNHLRTDSEDGRERTRASKQVTCTSDREVFVFMVHKKHGKHCFI